MSRSDPSEDEDMYCLSQASELGEEVRGLSPSNIYIYMIYMLVCAYYH